MHTIQPSPISAIAVKSYTSITCLHYFKDIYGNYFSLINDKIVTFVDKPRPKIRQQNRKANNVPKQNMLCMYSLSVILSSIS